MPLGELLPGASSLLSAGMTTLSVESAGDLQRLYRASEERGTRLRLVLDVSRQLAISDIEGLPTALAFAADRAALLLGYRRGSVREESEPPTPPSAGSRPATVRFPLVAPGSRDVEALVLCCEAPLRSGEVLNADDLDAVQLMVQLMGAAVAARRREGQLASLLDELMSAQERERAHLSGELHDGVAQLATAALRRIEMAAPENADAERAAALTRELVGELRRVISGMRPTALDDLGLAAALEALTASLARDGWAVTLTCGELPPLSAALENAIFRIVQESLTNVRRHAGLCRVDVEVVTDMTTRDVSVRVCDLGRGFVPPRQQHTAVRQFGLALMRERVRALGGRLTVDAAPGRGCCIAASFPSTD